MEKSSVTFDFVILINVWCFVFVLCYCAKLFPKKRRFLNIFLIEKSEISLSDIYWVKKSPPPQQYCSPDTRYLDQFIRLETIELQTKVSEDYSSIFLIAIINEK